MADRDPDSRKGPGSWAQQAAVALDLPLVIIGGAVVGGALGYFLDRWLHTTPYLMLVLGLAGFAVGVRDVIRRTSKN